MRTRCVASWSTVFWLCISSQVDNVDAFYYNPTSRRHHIDSGHHAAVLRRELVTKYLIDPRISPHLQGSDRLNVGIIVIDHGSKKDAANAQLHELVAEMKIRHNRPIVEAAHMELAAPSIRDAFASCVSQGAQKIVCHPYFLSAGRHATEDIPALVKEASSEFPDVPYVLTEPLGSSDTIPDLIEDVITTALENDEDEEGEWALGGFFGEIMEMMDDAGDENQEDVGDDDELDIQKDLYLLGSP